MCFLTFPFLKESLHQTFIFFSNLFPQGIPLSIISFLWLFQGFLFFKEFVYQRFIFHGIHSSGLWQTSFYNRGFKNKGFDNWVLAIWIWQNSPYKKVPLHGISITKKVGMKISVSKTAEGEISKHSKTMKLKHSIFLPFFGQ